MSPKLTSRVRWGYSVDRSYFSMWVVHPVDDTNEQSKRRFYFIEERDAQDFLRLVEKSCHVMA